MRAVVFDRYGGEEVLHEQELPDPVPGPGEVLVRVAATSVNPADWRLRRGDLRWFVRLRFPFVPGADVAGVVHDVGPGVVDLAVGDAVVALLPTRSGGACAELVRVRAEHVAPAPRTLPLADAAALPLVGSTALQALRDRARLHAGQRLLVHGAAGGVGTLAVQLGHVLGAQVTAVAAGRLAALLHDLGADEVLDRNAVPVRQLGRQFDVVVDCVDALSTRALRRLLVPGGTAVSVNPGRGVTSPLTAALHGRRRVRPVLVSPSGDDLRTLVAMVDAGDVCPVVERQVPLADLAAAQRENALGRAQGKTVVVVDPRFAAHVPAGVRG